MATPTRTDDIQIDHHGSIALVRPITTRARRWLTTHIGNEATWFGGALAVEPRYLSPLVDGMIDDGLHVSL